MATQAPNAAPLPLLYNGLDALNSGQHGKMKLKKAYTLPQVGKTHAVPVTVEEFTIVQRHYPIIFSAGENPGAADAGGVRVIGLRYIGVVISGLLAAAGGAYRDHLAVHVRRRHCRGRRGPGGDLDGAHHRLVELGGVEREGEHVAGPGLESGPHESEVVIA